jgi:DNA polymerase-3 subunit delta
VLDGIAAGKSPPQLWRDVRVWGNAHQQLMQKNCRRFTKEQVEAAIVHAAKVDRTVKGLIRGNAWDELLQLALRFATGAPAKSLPKQGKIAATARAAERSQTGLF